MEKQKKTKDIAVFYHGNCPDGFGGAYTAWKKLGGTADYFPLLWQRLNDAKTKAKTVYFIDFSPEELIKKFKAEGKKIILIDHHITAKDFMRLADVSLFDINKSGATLAWNYFYPKKKVPKMLAHIQDQDIWQFKLKNTKEINKFVGLEEMEFKRWDKLCQDLEKKDKYKNAVSIGSYLLKESDTIANRIMAEGIREAKFENKKSYVVNSPYYESYIGNVIAKDGAVGIIWSMRRDGRIKVSLRSIGNLDVSKLAKKYGGGGHKNAASFTVNSFKDVPWTYKE